MEYRVEQLAAAAGVRVDTVRFYQARGLLPAPKRVRRHALYSEAHLARLRQIRRYQAQGLSLAVIARLLRTRARGSAADTLLEAVADQAGERTLTRSELAGRTGVPEALLVAVEHAGLLRPVTVGGEARFGEEDVQIARAGMEILAQGFPLDQLLSVAAQHARAVEASADAAIDLFDRFVRGQGADARRASDVGDAFRRLLPAVTTLVALHFQRTLLSRALDRLAQGGERDALDAAQALIGSGRLEVAWR
jgi:DNA-binding transcriptional MerR regulator